MRFPRVLGIEAVGEVVDPGGGDLAPGQVVAAAMGGMGRDFDGGYEEYALLPAAHVIPVTTTLDWPRLASLPESFGTAWGSLGVLGLRRGGRCSCAAGRRRPGGPPSRWPRTPG